MGLSRLVTLTGARRLEAVVAAMTLALLASPPALEAGFTTAVSYGTGTSPKSLVVGDFNRDGRQDLAAANGGSNNVSVLLANSNGTFQTAVAYGAGTSPSSVAAGDFNGDGLLDLVVANSGSANVSVLLGNGNGTFQAAVAYGAGTSPASVAVGDLNGDGWLDLVVANSGSANVSVLLGKGDGTFQAAVAYGAGTSPSFVATGDFNADGKQDLAVANAGSDNVSVLLGNGNGTFQAAVAYGAGANPSSVTVADLSGDGKQDLAVANAGSDNVSVLLGNGDGTFQAAVAYAAGTGPAWLTAEDLDGNGRRDLVVSNSSGTVSVLPGNGNGTFQAAVPYPVGTGPAGGVVADFNRDGRKDLAIATSGGNAVGVLLNNASDASCSSRTSVSYGVGFNPVAVSVSDFNRDGLQDLAVANAYSDNVSILLGNADGTFQSAVNYPTGTTPSATAVGDFNADGRLDLAVSNRASNDVSILLGNGDGTFQPAVSYAVGTTPNSVAVADFNRDGQLDLVVVNRASGTASVLLGNGNGTFKAAVSYAVGLASGVAVADLNRDGKPDLAFTTSWPGNVVILLGNGDGTFQSAVNYAVGNGLVGLVSLVAGDLNGDGAPDIAVANNTDNTLALGSVAVLLGNGNGTFQAAVNYAVGGNTLSGLAVGDFNGDGRQDLAVGGPNNVVSVLLGNGDGSFQLPTGFGVGTGPTSVSVGDLNRDGRQDLVVTNSSGTVSVLLNACTFVTSTVVVSSVNPAFYAQPVTLTATVSSGTGGSGVPTGTVTFLDGAAVLGTGTLAGGVATLATAFVVNGTHPITAVYAGDGTFNGSTSAVLSQIVNYLQANLTVTKTDGQTSAVPGMPIAYTIVVSNAGPQGALGATVADTLPVAITNASWTCTPSGGATCTASNTGGISDSVNLPAGSGVTYVLTGTVSASSTGTLSNSAFVVALPPGVVDPNPADNTATDNDTLTPQADLSITNTDGQASAIPGTSITYTIVASNAGPSAVTGATVTDTSLVGTITGATWTCSGAGVGSSCTASGSGSINDAAVNLPEGGKVTYTLTGTVSASATGSLVNTATVTAPGGVTDPAPGNNTATDTDTLTPQADLSITTTDGQTDRVPGTTVTYTIVASNAGPSAAPGTTVADILPAAITGASWTCAGGGSAACPTASGSGSINQTVSLPAGGSLTYTLTGTISASATGSLVNTATVAQSASVTDPTPGNNSATDTDTLTPRADLSITKTDGQDNAVPGAPITYTIVVSNAGPSAAPGTTVTDSLPPAIAGATWTCAGIVGGSCTASGSGSINDSVNLPAGGTVTYILTGTVGASLTGSVSNTATVTPLLPVIDLNLLNNSATDTDTLKPQADLSITKTDGQASAVPGAPITYTIVASNAGPSVAGATVTDGVPAAITGASWTCVGAGGASCPASGSGNNINDSVNLPAGGSVTYTLTGTVSASATGSVSNTATVTPLALVIDPNPTNNSATDTDTLTPHTDLSITKTDGQAIAVPGLPITYTIVVSNAGPSAASGATVADAVPAAITGVTWTCVGAGGGICAASGSGSIGATVNLPVGGTVTYTLTGIVSASATGSLSNTATVAAPGGATDTNLTNNSATDTDTLTPRADLSITKTDGQLTAVPGLPITYTIVASNAGPSAAPGTTVADAVPAAITGASWTCVGAGGASCPASGSGVNINDSINLPPGGTVTYTLTGTLSAAATGSLSNTATVTAPGGVTDPTPANNTATDTDTLTPQADLSITKTDGQANAVPGAPITYTIVASNTGPSAAPGATVTDAVPAAITGVTWTCMRAGGGICTASGSGSINDTVNLPAGGSVTYALTGIVGPTATGGLSNAATVAVSGGVTDPNLANNSAIDTDTLEPAKVSIADAQVLEGNAGTKSLVLPVTLSQAAGTAMTVNYATSDGTAKAGEDYLAASGTLTIAAGQTSGSVSVTILGDTMPEPDETFTVTLSGPSGVSLGRGTATGTIQNDDHSAVDLDGDGKSDILWRAVGGPAPGAMFVWLMNGKNISGATYLDPISTDWVIQGTGDFNGDGKSDILWRNMNPAAPDAGNLYVWLMDGPNVIGKGYTNSQANFEWQVQGIGDLDGDGKSDIVWRSVSGAANGALFLWLMDGTSIKGATYLDPIASDWVIQRIGDFTGDGKADILWRNMNPAAPDAGKVYLWVMDGSKIVAGTGYPNSQADFSWKVEAIGDLDGDGKQDIVWRAVSGAAKGAMFLWLMDGKTIKGATYLDPISTDWQVMGTGDFNGDGKADILWRNMNPAAPDAGNLYLWLMNGSQVIGGTGYTNSQADFTWDVKAPH